MSIKRVGTRLIVENASDYLSTMQKAAGANKEFGQSGKDAAVGLTQMNTRSAAVAVTVGSLLATAVSRGAGALAGLKREAIDSVVQHERLSQSMTSLVAKELQTAGVTEDMGDALAQAAPRAQELLKWIQQLAIKSPFDQQGVAEAFRMALAYGFTSTEAQRLTAATIDFSTATGASSEAMSRMSLALGQVKARGRLMGGEILQLVSAGVNVNAILKEMGFTMQDVSAGTVEAGAFIEQFTQTLERDFGGAAARSSETLGGLINTMGDLRKMGLRALIQPAITAALPSLSQMTTKMQEFIPTIERVGFAIGEFVRLLIENRQAVLSVVGVLGAMVGGYLLVTTAIPAVIGAVGGLGTAIAGLLTPIGLLAGGTAVLVGAFAAIALSVRSFRQKEAAQLAASTANLSDHMQQRAVIAVAGEQQRLNAMGEMGDKIRQNQAKQNQQTANESRSWGENIVIQFAQGMANAIAAVVSVLVQIGQVIAGWLAPGSPPKILPKIDKWGTAAMQEYVDGMTAVDLGTFSTLTNKIGGFLNSIPGLGRAEGVGKTLELRQLIMGMVEELNSTGAIGAGSFTQLNGIIGTADNNIQSYVQALVQAQAAQERLNDITQHYSDILNPMRDQLKGLQKQRQDYIDGKRREELNNIISRATAAGDTDAVYLANLELQEMALQDQIAATEEQEAAAVSAAQEQVDAAAEQLAMQEALIDAQVENNNLIREQIDLLRSLAEGGAAAGGGGIGDALGGIGGGIPTPGAIAMPTAPTGGMMAGLEGFAGRVQELIGQITAPFAELEGDFESLGSTWNEVITRMGERGLALSTTLSQLRVILFSSLSTASTASTAATQLGQIVGFYLFGALARASTAASQFGDIVRFTFWNVLATASTAASQLVQIVAFSFFNILNRASTAGSQLMGIVRFAFWNVLATASTAASQLVQIVTLGWQLLKLRTSEKFDEIKEKSSDTWQNIKEGTVTKVGEVYTAVTDKITEIKTWLADQANQFFNIGANLMTGMKDGILDAAVDVIASVMGIVTDIINGVRGLLDEHSPSRVFFDIGRNAGIGMAMGVTSEAGNVRKSFASYFQALPATTAVPRQNTTYNQRYDQRQIQGIGQVQTFDFKQLETMIRQVINDEVARR